MKNIEAIERFEQAYCSRIDKLFWIAGSFENSELKELLEELDDKQWKELFPEIFKSEYFEEYKDEPREALINFKKFGLIAEIHIPTCDKFEYKNGKPVSWSIHQGCCLVEYVYAETLEELMNKTEEKAEKVFQEFVKKDKKKQPLIK